MSPSRAVRALGRVAVALGLAVWQPALGTTYLALSPQEVLESADAVLTATVADVTARVDDAGVWTVVTLEVREWLTDDPRAGEDEAPRETVVIEVLGGEAEGRRLIVAGGPTWRPGDEVLVALHADSGLATPVVGFSQGLWRSVDGGLVDPGGRYLALDPGGALVRADGSTPAPTVLDAVRLALAGEAPAPAEPGEGEPGEAGAPPEEGEVAGEDDGPAGAAPEGAAAPARPVAASYRVDDAGGPLLLSDKVAAAAAAWEALAPGLVELTESADAGHLFAYGDEALFGPGVLTLTLVEDGRVRVLVRPEAHPSLDAALRHEVGALLGLPPADAGVMAMALADPAAAPGPAELAELAALAAFEPADLDRDGVVGFGDLLELAASYGRTGVNLPADLDGDGDVDDDDVALLRRAYAFAPPAGAAPGEGETGGASPATPGQGAAGEAPAPAGPAAPEGAGEPEEPDGPEGPDAPEGSAEPGQPGEPEEPQAPGGPDEPEEPDGEEDAP